MKTVIFDLYGTLVDIRTDEEDPRFWERFASEERRYRDCAPEALRRAYLAECAEAARTREEIEITAVFEKLFPAAEATAVARDFRRLSTRYLRAYPGVRLLLRSLRRQGFRLFLLSNAQRSFTELDLEGTGLLSLFDGVFLSSDKGIKKPDPEFFRLLCDTYGIDPGGAVMVGNDYRCDILPAKSLGMKTVYMETATSVPHPEAEKLRGFRPLRLLRRLRRESGDTK